MVHTCIIYVYIWYRNAEKKTSTSTKNCHEKRQQKQMSNGRERDIYIYYKQYIYKFLLTMYIIHLFSDFWKNVLSAFPTQYSAITLLRPV